MAKHLVIVESPAKAKTLGKYLGRDYQVKASIGHVVDLPKSKLGVDIENDFETEYTVIHGKNAILNEIKQAAKDKDTIYLAPDPDREGEAIAWHIAQKLGHPKRKNVRRVLFNEITKKAVLDALQHPRDLDQNLFEAQQARRVLDRLVGYRLSPLLWEKVRRGLSAGRVQSVAVRIIVEREREITAFVPEEYWTVEARLEAGQPPLFTARLAEVDGQKVEKQLKLDTRERVDEILRGLDGASHPPFHHVAAAAGGVAQARIPALPHHAYRAAALRGRRARRGRGRRPHHVHAHGLDADLGRGHRGRA